jgi:hypothetical protein
LLDTAKAAAATLSASLERFCDQYMAVHSLPGLPKEAMIGIVLGMGIVIDSSGENLEKLGEPWAIAQLISGLKNSPPKNAS